MRRLQIDVWRVGRLCLFLITLLVLPRAAQADTPTPSEEPTLSTIPVTFSVTGKITSGTAGVPVPGGIPITLYVAHNDPKTNTPVESVKRDAALAADLTFNFDKVTATPGDILFVSTVFQGIVQGSPPIRVANSQQSLDVPLPLYAVTNDPTVITLLHVQHILDIKAGILQILATYVYQNSSDRLYLSKERTADNLPVSVHVPLPIGARAIAFNSQNTVRFNVGGDPNAPIVQDTKPVVPGQVDQIVFSYQVPYSEGTPIDQDYPYNTTALEVLIPDDARIGISQIKIDANQPDDSLMTRASNTTINAQRSYSQYVLKTPLKAGDRLVYFLGKAQNPPPAQTPQQTTQIGLPQIAALFVLLAIVLAAVVFGGSAVQRSKPAGKPRRKV